ncbi:hypothetical protein C5167_029401 [Papaver somniferum]|nr:hypothetical protein C5167_029401 [Papaver somniferum]
MSFGSNSILFVFFVVVSVEEFFTHCNPEVIVDIRTFYQVYSVIQVPEVDTSVRSLTVMWDGSLVVAANNNKTCYVWRLQRGTQTMTNFEPLHKLQAHDGYILKCLHSPGQIARVAIIFRVNEGLLPPLDDPHHLRKHEWVHIGKVSVTQKERGPDNTGTQVDAGLMKNIVVDQNLDPGIRVTLLSHNCSCINPQLLPQCGYSHKLGTSEHGVVLSSSELTIPTFRIHQVDGSATCGSKPVACCNMYRYNGGYES